MIRPRGRFSGSSFLLDLLPFAFLKPPAPLKHMPTDHIPCYCSLCSHLKIFQFPHSQILALILSFLFYHFLPWFLKILISTQKKASNTLTSQFVDLLTSNNFVLHYISNTHSYGYILQSTATLQISSTPYLTTIFYFITHSS